MQREMTIWPLSVKFHFHLLLQRITSNLVIIVDKQGFFLNVYLYSSAIQLIKLMFKNTEYRTVHVITQNRFFIYVNYNN